MDSTMLQRLEDKHAARKMTQRTRHQENQIPPIPQTRLAIVIPNK